MKIITTVADGPVTNAFRAMDDDQFHAVRVALSESFRKDEDLREGRDLVMQGMRQLARTLSPPRPLRSTLTVMR